MDNLVMHQLKTKEMTPHELKQTNGGSIVAVMILGVGLMKIGFDLGRELGRQWAEQDKVNN